MIDFYNQTITGKNSQQIINEPTWTRMDIFLDWENKQVTIYQNKTSRAVTGFYYSDVDNVDFIKIYNLKPNTVGYFKDIQLCDTESCDGYIFIQMIIG
ncbi:hypothetical protein IMG5_024600 [Ichthyophthirius multifiliis]|uniref:Uncharacterized protein n=1 Tax=Ichthyophthirius multifiliis TaxID=5932 RepID=G0QL33_ICHMU|nr:hypothetical protein IMG5_024600 [Ichthyophthirius multifiliis]EGR34089.1 hypothetical protein IMG5_024600 [Ichthyophthirius multifiliis]|eukprot:XP_004039393.1 hypothetical protein IMG5_024600 [Ichthyophthirius multifiliis]